MSNGNVLAIARVPLFELRNTPVIAPLPRMVGEQMIKSPASSVLWLIYSSHRFDSLTGRKCIRPDRCHPVRECDLLSTGLSSTVSRAR